MRTDLGEIFIHIFLDIGSIHNLLRLAVLHNEKSRCLHDAVLCGKIWVPKHDPSQYPVCPDCKRIYEEMMK